jgi:glycosyltransferase involved in cell wall biosynthesis
MTNDLVSVILPVHNGQRWMAEAVASVLSQAYRPLEIIVVDDGSTDDTARIGAGFGHPVRYFRQGKAGPAAARNLGIQNARGAFLAFIDSDDLWPADKLRRQMSYFETFPAIEIVQGLVRRIKIEGAADGRMIGADIDFPFIHTNLGAMVMRRPVFEKIGYLEESLPFHEDSDFWLRAREAGINILLERKVGLIYRIHGENLTTGGNLKSMGFLRVIRRSIDRRRSPSGLVRQLGDLTYFPDLLHGGQLTAGDKTGKPETWPLVSIILYAAGQTAKADAAISSIRGQAYQPAELLIVGPGADAVHTAGLEHFERIEILGGQSDRASALNAGIERSHGDMIAFLDAEAEWAAQKLKTQVAYLLEHPGDGCVVGRARQMIIPGKKYPSDLLDELSLRRSLGDLLGTLVVRRSTMNQVGGFQAGLPGMEETDWLLRAGDKGFPPKMLPHSLLYRSVQPDSHIGEVGPMTAALLDSVRSSVHRKRDRSRLQT